MSSSVDNAYEKSAALGAPIELYEFKYGDGPSDVIRITNADSVVTVGSGSAEIVFTPIAIQRSNIDYSDQIDQSNQVSFSMERGGPLEILLASTDIAAEIRVSVIQAHHVKGLPIGETDNSLIGLWSGMLVSYATLSSSFDANCSTIGSTLAATGVSMRYQRSCPWPVYDRGCRLKLGDFATYVTVQEVNGSSVTVSPHGKPDDYFVGGVMKMGSAQRFIVKSSGNTLFLSSNMLSIQAGDEVTIHPGCDRSPQTCNEKFNNILNFGGLSFNPPTSPFGSVGFY